MEASGSISDDDFMEQFFFDDFDSMIEQAVVEFIKADNLRMSAKRNKHGGSQKGKKANKNRGILGGASRIHSDYFAEESVYDETDFRRRFRMSKELFLKIVNSVSAHEQYFTQRPDCTGKMGATATQKVTAVLKVLVYGTTADAFDDYVRLSETTINEAVRLFVKSMNEVFGPTYLRPPRKEDILFLSQENAKRGLPGMVGSLDCTHWGWEMCPNALKGQYQDR
jgi:hypothetical protein